MKLRQLNEQNGYELLADVNAVSKIPHKAGMGVDEVWQCAKGETLGPYEHTTAVRQFLCHMA